MDHELKRHKYKGGQKILKARIAQLDRYVIAMQQKYSRFYTIYAINGSKLKEYDYLVVFIPYSYHDLFKSEFITDQLRYIDLFDYIKIKFKEHWKFPRKLREWFEKYTARIIRIYASGDSIKLHFDKVPDDWDAFATEIQALEQYELIEDILFELLETNTFTLSWDYYAYYGCTGG